MNKYFHCGHPLRLATAKIHTETHYLWHCCFRYLTLTHGAHNVIMGIGCQIFKSFIWSPNLRNFVIEPRKIMKPFNLCDRIDPYHIAFLLKTNEMLVVNIVFLSKSIFGFISPNSKIQISCTQFDVQFLSISWEELITNVVLLFEYCL